MKITFLGTGAGESYPGLFCDCKNCRYAREHGGRNIRVNTTTLIDDDTLLDMNDNCIVTAANLCISFTSVKRLLITHYHDDHISPRVLWWRQDGEGEAVWSTLSDEERLQHSSPRFVKLPVMEVFGSRNTRRELMREKPDMFDDNNRQKIVFKEIIEGKTYVSGDLTFTPVRSMHGGEGFCHNYILQRGGKTLLYSTDCGGYDDEMIDLISSFKLDAVVMEGTFGLSHVGGHHMNLEKNIHFRDLFIERGCIDSTTPFYLTHMSPHWTPPYDLYRPMAAEKGFTVAYDGMQVEI